MLTGREDSKNQDLLVFFTGATLAATSSSLNTSSVASSRPNTIKQTVFKLLDEDESLRRAVASFERGALSDLTHRVAAVKGLKVNPATVDRCVRRYKKSKGWYYVRE